MNDTPREMTTAWIATVLVLASVIPVCRCCLAREAEVRGSLQGTSLLNTDLGAAVVDGRLDTEVEFSHFTLGGTYRAYHLSRKRYNPRGIEVPQPQIKHRYVEVNAGDTRGAGRGLLRMGHFFGTFDRGLTLRSFEDVDLEQDTALDGILGEYEVGGIKVSALSGKMVERVSELRSREHRLGGGRIVVSQGGVITLAASGIGRRTERHDKEVDLPEELRDFDDTIFGTEAELRVGPLHLAGDYSYREGDYYPRLEKGDVPGHGAYFAGTLITDYFTVLGEYKDYERFDNALVNPPTCVREHLWTLMNRVTHQVDLDDERGFLVEGTLALFDDMPVTGSASEARNDNGDLVHWEMFGQVERPIADLGRASVGASWSREYVSRKFTEYMTGMLEAELNPETGAAFEFGLGGQMIEEPSGQIHQNYLASMTWYPAAPVTLSGVAEATTERNLERDFWLFGQATIVIADGLDASLGFGTERGGKKCSGGVCYTEPEFAGIRLRLSRVF